MDASRQEARGVHVHSSWCRGPDTVKRPLEAPIFRFPSGYVYLRTGVATGLGFRTYIYVRNNERVNNKIVDYQQDINLFLFIQGRWSTFRRDGTRLPDRSRRSAVPQREALRGVRPVQGSRVRPLRPDCDRKLTQQHVRMSPVQE